MAEMKVFVINLDEQEKDTGCAWFTLPCNIEALKQSIGLPPDSDRYLISDYDFPFEILQDTDLDLCYVCGRLAVCGRRHSVLHLPRVRLVVSHFRHLDIIGGGDERSQLFVYCSHGKLQP